MRVCLTLAFAVAVGACTGTRSDDASADERSIADRQQTFVLQDRLCVPQAWTIEQPPDQQAPVSEPIGDCGNYVDEAGRKANPIACGPCGFSFDPVVTRSARARVADACCYEVSSPPPPQLPVPDPDPRFACTKNGDCVASCRHGAVARMWHEATYPGDEACEDGCTSKGTEPPMCMNGGCVARRAKKDDPPCTRLDHPPIEGPGPAHACQRDSDCTNDCALGAINATWLSTRGDREGCKDGCTSKGTDAPTCEDGACVAYRLGNRDESCTLRPVW